MKGTTVRFTPNQIRALLVTLAFVFSVLVGVVAGVLAHQDQHSVPGAILSGGGAFVTFMTLSILVMGALGWLSNNEPEVPAQDRQSTTTLTDGSRGGRARAQTQRTEQ
ncbi:hypothetical protein ABZZ74_49170 [Streptomyces sp. NPDC006476]|uniref:hypothetical protein n=1 Tax=Streptomyces sp. NPDC006476 TaxID=3157175 RepID=UPI0033AE33D6